MMVNNTYRNAAAAFNFVYEKPIFMLNLWL